jgi:hypothetical protein
LISLPCAALWRSWEFGIQTPFGLCLLHSCMMSIIRFLLLRGYCFFTHLVLQPGFHQF